MEGNNLTFRLSETGIPSGQIPLDGIAKLASSVQELATRVGRFVVGQNGTGRTLDAAAQVVGLRLTGLAAGSTRLSVSFGADGVLPLEVGIEADIAERFWDVLAGIESGTRPEWVTPLVAESAARVIDAFSTVAGQVEISRVDGRRAYLATPQLDRDIWQLPKVVQTTEAITVAGRLEKVDLFTRKFRIRDDVGNTILLEEVADADAAGPLVGQRTEASGLPGYDAAGQLRAINGAHIVAAERPAAWTAGFRADVASIVASAPGPDPDGVNGLTSAEVDEFLASLKS